MNGSVAMDEKSRIREVRARLMPMRVTVRLLNFDGTYLETCVGAKRLPNGDEYIVENVVFRGEACRATYVETTASDAPGIAVRTEACRMRVGKDIFIGAGVLRAAVGRYR